MPTTLPPLPPPGALTFTMGAGEGAVTACSVFVSAADVASLCDGLSGLAFCVFVLDKFGGSTEWGSIMAALSFCCIAAVLELMGDVLADVVGVTAVDPLCARRRKKSPRQNEKKQSKSHHEHLSTTC